MPLISLFLGLPGVILESENLHRIAYNAAFTHFNVSCTGGPVVDWTVEFYDMLQNKVGGGIPKMRWYFGELIATASLCKVHGHACILSTILLTYNPLQAIASQM